MLPFIRLIGSACMHKRKYTACTFNTKLRVHVLALESKNISTFPSTTVQGCLQVCTQGSENVWRNPPFSIGTKKFLHSLYLRRRPSVKNALRKSIFMWARLIAAYSCFMNTIRQTKPPDTLPFTVQTPLRKILRTCLALWIDVSPFGASG